MHTYDDNNGTTIIKAVTQPHNDLAPSASAKYEADPDRPNHIRRIQPSKRPVPQSEGTPAAK